MPQLPTIKTLVFSKPTTAAGGMPCFTTVVAWLLFLCFMGVFMVFHCRPTFKSCGLSALWRVFTLFCAASKLSAISITPLRVGSFSVSSRFCIDSIHMPNTTWSHSACSRKLPKVQGEARHMSSATYPAIDSLGPWFLRWNVYSGGREHLWAWAPNATSASQQCLHSLLSQDCLGRTSWTAGCTSVCPPITVRNRDAFLLSGMQFGLAVELESFGVDGESVYPRVKLIEVSEPHSHGSCCPSLPMYCLSTEEI